MQTANIQLEGIAYRCAVATRWIEWRRGLAGTARAEWIGIDGLLLQFPFPWWWSLWMRGMQFPIDIFWLNGSVIIDRRCNATPHPWKIYWPRARCTAVFERLPQITQITRAAPDARCERVRAVGVWES